MKSPVYAGLFYSPGWTRTNNPPVNSRMLCQLSYRGRQRPDCSRALGPVLWGGWRMRPPNSGRMRRFAVVGVAVSIGVLAFAPSGLAASARVAALQIGLRAHGFDPGPVDGVRGQLTTNALIAFQRARGVSPTGRVGRATRRALGARGRPLLGQRELGVGAVGWDVAVLEFRLRRYGLGRRCASTGGSRGARASRCAATRVDAVSLPTASPARGRIGRWPVTSRRRPGTSSNRARASSRSRRATTSAPGVSLAATASS